MRRISRLNLAVASVATLAVTAIGLYVIQAFGVSGIFNVEPERTDVRGASVINDPAASGGKALQFKASVTPAVVDAPDVVKAHTGGDSIAVVWQPSRNSVKHYEVYRDSEKVATIVPGNGVVRGERNGTRYIDTSVVRGTTYQYRVKAVTADGRTSDLTTAVPATHPTDTTPVPTVTYDASAAPELAGYLEQQAIPEIKTWYPKIADASAYPDYTPTGGMHIMLDPANTGIAYAVYAERLISVNPAWLRDNPEDAGGMFIHEATHILQSYPNNPHTWLTEGIADWTRDWFTLERYPAPIRPAPNDNAKLTDSYSTSAYLLRWLEVNYSPDIIRKLNIALNKNTYTDNFFPALTGKTYDQLWLEMRRSSFSPAAPVTGLANKCLDVAGGVGAAGTKLQLLGCNGQNAQQWTLLYRDLKKGVGSNGTFDIANASLGTRGWCVDVQNSDTASGTPVRLWGCNSSNAQEWETGPNISLINPHSGKCLSTLDGGNADGTQLVIDDCDGSDAQRWILPE